MSPDVLDLLFDYDGAMRDLIAALRTHPPTPNCPDLECLICGYRDCPHHDPLHYHHDGCPACEGPTTAA